MKQLLKTKHAGKKLAAVLIAFTLFLPSLTAQVTIGADLEPNDGSLLQLKEKEPEVARDYNSSKGFNLPRVRLSVKTSLYPMFLKKPDPNDPNDPDDPNDPALGPNAQYESDSTNLKAHHTGMMVYNLTTTGKFNEGIYVWDGTQWVLSRDESINPVQRLIIPLDQHEITTEGRVYYGTITYSEEETDMSSFAIVSLVPIILPSPTSPDFISKNLYFSSAVRREEVGGRVVAWKLRIHNDYNYVDPDTGQPDLDDYATVDALYVNYISTGGTFSETPGGYITVTNYEGY